MLVMAVHQTPSLTQERYEEVVRRLTGKDRAQSPSDFPFDGLVAHAAGEGQDGFFIVDIWESEDAAHRFSEAIASIARDVGIKEPPEFFPVHTYVSL